METIKNIAITSLVLSFFSIFLLGLAGIFVLPHSVSAEDINVTATVEEWVSFAVSPTTTDLGTLVDASGNVSIGSATSGLTLNSNSFDGYSVSIQGANGGLENGIYLIATPAAAATTTCSAAGDGTDAYGAQATSATLTVQSPFNVSGDVVGSVASSSSQSLLSSAYSTSSQSAILTVKASANKFDASGSYSDTLTLTALPNP